MRFPGTELTPARDNLRDHAHRKVAPMVMWNPMLRLAGKRDIVASLAHCRLDEHHTTWRALWLTDRQLIFAEASKALENWSAHSDDQDGSDTAPDTFAAWATPLRDIAALDIPTHTVKRVNSHTEGGRTWVYEGHVQVTTAHGKQVSLPLFPDDDNVEADEVLAMITAIVNRS